jgi:amino-acid N-acetyltransferase
VNTPAAYVIRNAIPKDVPAIRELVEPYAEKRILIAKEAVTYYEAVQEFVVISNPENPRELYGCGALHVMWEELAEIRTLAVSQAHLGQGIGHTIVEHLLKRARAMELRHVFCLTFETKFFERHGFKEIEGTPVGVDVYAELLRSHDDGVAEFLDLARVKPNTLGNSRMFLEL